MQSGKQPTLLRKSSLAKSRANQPSKRSVLRELAEVVEPIMQAYGIKQLCYHLQEDIFLYSQKPTNAKEVAHA